MSRRFLTTLLAAVLLSACSDTQSEFTSSRCNLVFDNTSGRSTALAAAMNSASPGTFCAISVSGKYFTFELNSSAGTTERVAFTAVDDRLTMAIGVYNESGIIVGYGNISYPATFYAYDRQCPNCYKDTNMPRYVLNMSTAGKAKCSHCGREYDMNNGGIVSSGDAGDKLMRYRATTTGAQGVLSVNN